MPPELVESLVACFVGCGRQQVVGVAEGKNGTNGQSLYFSVKNKFSVCLRCGFSCCGDASAAVAAPSCMEIMVLLSSCILCETSTRP